MDNKKIINFLEECDLEDVKDKSFDKSKSIFNFTYYFDDLELESASEYANDECEEEKQSESWYYDYLLPYLTDFAMDNVEDVINDCSEEMDLNYELICYEPSEDNFEHINFLVIFSKEEIENIDDIVFSVQ
ncbi:hypothetical protein [Clostridium senegalense]|uniref:hypothetical protein n=1 Tax=Clostridium senegalense TaxID=1465809 RepID=UPI000288AE68|nr:hypothetical protein [Clostridium senegalense]